MIKIQDLIHEKLVAVDMEALDKDDLFNKMAKIISQNGFMSEKDEENLCISLTRRENIGSTAVGFKIAIPHAYFDAVTQPLVIFCRLSKGITFGVKDGKLVDKFFLVVGPKRSDTKHLMILARLSRLLRDKSFIEQLDSCSSGDEFITAVSDVESRH